MPGFIADAHGAKGPFYIIELLEAKSLGQIGAVANDMSKRRVFVLQKGNDLVDGLQVVFFQVKDAAGVIGERDLLKVDGFKKLLQPLAGKEVQDDFNSEVCLVGFNVLSIQKAFQVRRSRVGRIQLREGRRDE